MSHDGGPSPMYWVIWSVFRISGIFQVFHGQHGVPVLLQMLPEGTEVIQMVSGGGLDIPGVLGHNCRSLDVLGCV